jgi:predicted nucleotide-binding protein (sugar kinase/HSP70/actin superfamily)
VDTLRNGKSIVRGLLKCRSELSQIAIDRSQPKPLVSIIGEFWAMTTEGE